MDTTNILPQQTDLSRALEKEKYSLEFFTWFAIPLYGRALVRGRMVVQEPSPEQHTNNGAQAEEQKVIEAIIVGFIPELWRGGTVVARKVHKVLETADPPGPELYRGELDLSESSSSSVRGVPASFWAPQLLGRRSQAVGAEMSETEEPDNAQHEEA